MIFSWQVEHLKHKKNQKRNEENQSEKGRWKLFIYKQKFYIKRKFNKIKHFIRNIYLIDENEDEENWSAYIERLPVKSSADFAHSIH